ncbi:MAG: hypothetical protein ABIU85_00230 [Methylotenera sp.]
MEAGRPRIDIYWSSGHARSALFSDAQCNVWHAATSGTAAVLF